MKQLLISISLAAMATFAPANVAGELRAPANPLVTVDPYTSCWSTADNLYDDVTRHWTGKEYPLLGVISVDGVSYRFMGKEVPVLSSLVPTAAGEAWTGEYTTTKPADGWYKPGFAATGWKSDKGAFGSVPQEQLAKTLWNTEEIWVRREITVPSGIGNKPVYLNYSHDDDVIIYINGIKVVDTGNQCHKNVRLLLSGDVRKSLKPGKNFIAAWCRDRGGLAFLDFGLDIEEKPSQYLTKEAQQTSCEVLPMNTLYSFTCGPVNLDLKFTAPAFLDNLDLLSRPVNYISYNVESTDGKKHDIKFYFEAGREWAIDNITQKSVSGIVREDGITAVTVSSVNQEILAKSGDDLRIDWGTFYLASDGVVSPWFGDAKTARKNFVAGKKINLAKPGKEVGMTINKGKCSSASGYLMVGYDDIFSIQYFGTNLRPYWNRNNDKTIMQQLKLASQDYASLMTKTSDFDKKMLAEAEAVGGMEYAELCALAYRQAIAAHKLVESPQGDILWLSKENFSNGSIGTVDITYPSAPMFLLYNPELVKGLMNHILYYSESGKWTKPFAAHDVGTYPLANGQTYGGDMPVEESGNMLILAGALAKVEGNAEFAARHWNVLSTWAEYLAQYGLDPENQLCTDDFAGHFAHNANLSIKAILGVASYARLAEMLGKKAVAEKYFAKAKEMAAEWEKMADDGDHYRLTFDKPGTWSQKYNLVWDKMLGLNIFSDNIMKKEIPYYLKKQNTYGLPLDNRETYTKTDWIMWTATMAPDKATFEKFIVPVHKFMNETRHRVPMSDWIYTDRADQRGFQARAVVGGYFIKMLDERINKNK